MSRALLVLALVLSLAPVASAVGLPRVSQCVEAGCVQLQDNDADGAYEWVNVATAVGHVLVFNVHRGGADLLLETDASSEETVEPYHTASVLVYANATGEGVSEAWVFSTVLEGDEETGAQQQLAAFLVTAADTDGDGVPDDLRAGALP